MDMDNSSKALNKNTQFNTRNRPQTIEERTFFIVNVSFLCCPTNHQIETSIMVAQIHRIKTSSNAGIPVCIVKNPIDPNIAIEMDSFITADGFRINIKTPHFHIFRNNYTINKRCYNKWKGVRICIINHKLN